MIPLMARVIPEVLMGPYLVGFDPIGYYIPYVLKWLNDGLNFWVLMRESPLFYFILTPVASSGTTPLILLLKILPPFLHGFLALSIYAYASKALVWSRKKSLFVALLATLYFVALRVSWDLLRNELGLILFFATLLLLQKSEKRKTWLIAASLAMVAVALTHILVSVIMFTIVGVMIVQHYVKRRQHMALRLLMISIPAVLIFTLTISAGYIMPSIPPNLNVLNPEGGWLTLYGFSSYMDMSATMLSFLVYCYLPLLPLVILGAKYFKNSQIQTWVILCLIAAFSSILSTLAFRWLLMLIYPFAFFATEMIWSIKSKHKRLLLSTTLMSLVAILTIGFIAMPSGGLFQYYTDPQFRVYMPTSMLQNTVSQNDCPHVVNSLNWLKTNMPTNSVLLTHTAFYGWALQTFNTDTVISYGYGKPDSTAANATKQGYSQVYLIWWIEGKGWHGQPTISSSFKEVYQSGNIAIYLYENTTLSG
jgi:hypothetical protein